MDFTTTTTKRKNCHKVISIQPVIFLVSLAFAHLKQTLLGNNCSIAQVCCPPQGQKSNCGF